MQTQWAELQDDHTIEIIPLPEELLKEKKMQMVLCWDIGMTLTDKNMFWPQAIFAMEFDRKTGIFLCKDSKGEELTIDKSRIFFCYT